MSHPEIISIKPISEITNIPAPNMISNDSSSASLSSSTSSDTSKKGIDVDDMDISNGFAGEVLCTILQKLQRDKQTLNNLQKSRDTGTDFLPSMRHTKRWTAGVIFENNKCHLDEKVLQIATEHMKKKEEAYWKKERKYYDEYLKKRDYDQAYDEYKKRMTHNNLPIKILKPLCMWKKRKGDKKMPTKQDDLNKRWNETKDCCEISLEEYLMETTTLQDTYEKDHKGSPLTLDIINQMMIVRATSIVQPNVIDGNSVEV